MNREQEIRAAIIDDIMLNMGDECDIIRDALESYYALATVAELEAEYKERAFT